MIYTVCFGFINVPVGEVAWWWGHRWLRVTVIWKVK